MSPKGRTWLRDAEGCKLSAYQDQTGVWTIGVGHTGTVDGAPIGPGTTITLATCDVLLAGDLHDAEAAIVAAIAQRPTAPGQAQIDALVSFTFNAGVAAFAGSSIRRAFVAGHDAEVPNALLQWTRAGGDLDALAARRAREALMYTRGFYLGNSWQPL
jgi:lysozyme